MLYAVYHHAHPLVYINESKKDLIQWDWYFHQPQIDLDKLHTLPSVDCTHTTVSFQPHFKDIYNPTFIRLWGNLYANFVHLNDTTKQYIETEYQTLFSGKRRVLGVICRGTDYITLHPPGHPVQPSVDDVILHCKKLLNTHTYDAIYLATEEKQIRDTFCQAFPNMILENKRRYYDDIYSSKTYLANYLFLCSNRQIPSFLRKEYFHEPNLSHQRIHKTQPAGISP